MAQSKSQMSPVLFLAGIAIGSAITALLTPNNGRTMRQNIKGKAQQMKESAKNRASTMRKNDEQNPTSSPNNTSKSNDNTPKQ
jgi:gas vesicle protein